MVALGWTATLLESFITCNDTFASFAAYISILQGRACVAAFAAVCFVVLQINTFFAALLESFIADNDTFASFAACISIPRGRTCVAAFAAVCNVALQINAFFVTLRVSTPVVFAEHSTDKAGKQNGVYERHCKRTV